VTAPGSASIDDLLRYEDEPPPREPERGGLRTLARMLLVTAATTTVLAVLLRLGGVVVPVPLLAAGVLALLTLRHVVRLVSARGVAGARGLIGESASYDGMYHWATPDAMRRAVTRWEQRLTWHADTPGMFAAHLQPALRDLVDERLRLRYGTTVGADPDRARALLGEPLWALLTGDYRRGPGRRELTEAVSRIEELKLDPTAEGSSRG
jgi:hypothetical protein